MNTGLANKMGVEPPDTVDGFHQNKDLAVPGLKLKPNPDFLKANPKNLSLYLNPDQVRDLAGEFMPGGAFEEIAQRACAGVEKKIQSGSLGKVPKQFLFWWAGVLETFGTAYLLTGDAHVGAFLKYLILDTARRPTAYYTDRLIRAFKAEDPVGDLETSSLTVAFSRAAWFGRDLWTDSEWAEIQSALRDKMLVMNMNKLRVLPGNNYRAVIGCGAATAARAVGDTATFEKAKSIVVSYATDLLEQDGSSSEQVDYFFFPVSKVVATLMLLPRQAFVAEMEKTPLRGSADWVMNHFYYGSRPQSMDKIKVNFGDSDFGAKNAKTNAGTGAGWNEERLSLFALGLTWNRGDVAHFISRFETPAAKTLEEAILFTQFGVRSMTAVPPKSAMAATYQSGTAVFRNTWEDDGFVVALRGGAGGRTEYSHDRPNRGAMTLFAYGEPFIMTPGRFSYRNPLHHAVARATKSHSLMTLGGQAMAEKPISTFRPLEDDALAASVFLDLREAWSGVEAMRRRLIQHRTLGFAVLADRAVMKQPDTAEVRFLLNNIDGKLSVQTAAPRRAVAVRPRAFLQLVSTLPGEESRVEDAYVNTTYSYAIGDPGEGKLGSGKQLVFAAPAARVHGSLTLLLPQRTGEEAVAVAQGADSLTFKKQGTSVVISWEDGDGLHPQVVLTEKAMGSPDRITRYRM